MNTRALNIILTLIAVSAILALSYISYLYRAALIDLNRSVKQQAIVLKVYSDASKLELQRLKADNKQLSEELGAEQARVDELAKQVREIASGLGVLEELSQRDPELLKKYSRVYFLNENYSPKELRLIDAQFLYDEGNPEQVLFNVWGFLRGLLEEAEEAGLPMRVISAYRSFGEQSALKSQYTFIYGSGANKFSADQGYSEHQLGTAVDFTTPDLGAGFTKFGGTDAYQWLLDNAHRYGFVLSYPDGNAYYVFEPWHWRFVGRRLATDLHSQNRFFYDLGQREIDSYLIEIFY